MRSLDQYQRYIKEREQAGTQMMGDETATQAVLPAPKAAPLKPSKTEAKQMPKTRYVMRGGVTVPVSDEPIHEPINEPAAASAIVAPAPQAQNPKTLTPRTPAPKTVTDLDGTDIPAEAVETAAQTSASLWERLPRHIQLLAQIPAPLEEEVAQKYYTRGFRETREELIERLLDPPLTLEDTARVLGVCPATVRRYTNRGVLLHQRTVGQQRRFRLSDVLLFLEKQQNKSARSKK